MNPDEFATRMTAPVALVVGLLVCFLGYRLLKLSLGLIGFVGGATAGWAAGSLVAAHSNLVALVCAGLGGIFGAILCIWLFLFGVFILGASAGAVIAAAVLNATGHPPQPLPVLGAALVFGLLALVLQRLMITLSTAFSGAYLITAAIIHFLAGLQTVHPLWFERLPGDSAKNLSYIALGVWIVLGLLGVSVQYRHGKKAAKAPATEPKSS